MPVTGSTLRVEGLANLQRHFAIIDKELARDLRDGLKVPRSRCGYRRNG